MIACPQLINGLLQVPVEKCLTSILLVHFKLGRQIKKNVVFCYVGDAVA